MSAKCRVPEQGSIRPRWHALMSLADNACHLVFVVFVLTISYYQLQFQPQTRRILSVFSKHKRQDKMNVILFNLRLDLLKELLRNLSFGLLSAKVSVNDSHFDRGYF